MNYYVFYCFNDSTYKYLKGTHYAGVWADDLTSATKTIIDYVGANVMYIENPPKGITIGYLY